MDMQRTPRARLAHGSLIALLIGLAGCGGGGSVAADDEAASGLAAASGSSEGLQLVAQPPNTEGRLLASNCFQCHGTFGNGGFENIRGEEAGEVLEFMGKTANRDIMAAHAQGYTRAQLQKIISYLQQP
jgi:mono/diheme cytochrome c family protein